MNCIIHLNWSFSVHFDKAQVFSSLASSYSIIYRPLTECLSRTETKHSSLLILERTY